MSIKKVILSALPDALKEKIRKIKIYTPKEIVKDYRSCKAIRNVLSSSKTGSKINVAFIVQMAEIWDKESPIYDEMMMSPDFNVDMIIVPPYNQNKKMVERGYDKSNFFVKNYKDYTLAIENNDWIDISSKGYDYVFLQRPYDHYLPEGFKGSDLVNFAKVCYVTYAFTGAVVFEEGGTNKEFFRNVYFAFFESEHTADVLRKKFRTNLEKRMHRVLCCGYPALIPYFDFPDISVYRTIMWTPRWSFDPVIGGSNFMKYKDTFINTVKMHPECEFVFRPHPLMFGEIVEKGIMSENEVNEYIVLIKKLGVEYDIGSPIEESLKNADVLISDYSSILIQFFVTGRPIIYCDSIIELNDLFQTIVGGMYVVNNDKEYLKAVDEVLKNDYLKNKRKTIIQSDFEVSREATENIIKVIKRDYYGSSES